MKNSLELVGYLVKSGEVREVVALEIDGHCPARDYLIELAAHNPKGWQILSSQIRLCADVPRLQTRDTFKLLDPFFSRVASGAFLTIIEP